MLYGIDVSKWQSRYATLNNEGNTDFVMIKLTEGETYVDPMAANHTISACNKNVLIGFYHYARPDLHSDPTKEALNFGKRVLEFCRYYSLSHVMLALDFEEWVLGPNECDEWCRRWLDIVLDIVGYKPLLYVNGSRVAQFARVPEGDYGLWLARWPKTTPTHEGIASVRNNTHNWPVCAMWQYRGAPLDLDVFYGNVETWKKYAPLIGIDEGDEDDYKDDDEDSEDSDDVGFAHCGCPVCRALREVIQPNP